MKLTDIRSLSIYPLPYVSDRAPTPHDRYGFYKSDGEKFGLQIGTLWADTKNNECYVLKNIRNGLCEWENAITAFKSMNDYEELV